MTDEALGAVAGSIGADGIMCLWAKASVAEGYGERLRPACLPPMPAVLINPLVECSTAAVYGSFDALGHFQDIDGSGFAESANLSELVEALKGTRNDLQAPAIRIQPVINDVLKSLAAQPETLFSRMSGSGATCFALCVSDQDAEALAKRLEVLWPQAWVRSCTLS